MLVRRKTLLWGGYHERLGSHLGLDQARRQDDDLEEGRMHFAARRVREESLQEVQENFSHQASLEKMCC